MEKPNENFANPIIADWHGRVPHHLPPGINEYPLKYRPRRLFTGSWVEWIMRI
jgi:hypothetical protein